MDNLGVRCNRNTHRVPTLVCGVIRVYEVLLVML